MAELARPRDERIAVADGLELRVLRWDPNPAGSFPADEDSGLGMGDLEGYPGGTGSSYLLVHGLASNARLWDGVGRSLAQAGHDAVAVDLRGHGRSDKPDGGYDFASVSEDLRGLIAALGLVRPILAGQSWGANVVLDFAVRYPDLARGIVLVDGGLTDLRDAFPTWEVCWARLAPPQLVGLPLANVESYFRTNHADWPKEGLEGSLANFEIRPDRTIAPWLTREHHQAILAAMWGQRTAELWARLRVPALIVPVDGGENDWTSAKRAGVASALAATGAAGIPSRVRWFTGDHDVHAQYPVELAVAMLDAERTGLYEGVHVK
jgi:pimeloyl-ACP methyl ester carboxylesterase